jgi:hypothetical protein
MMMEKTTGQDVINAIALVRNGGEQMLDLVNTQDWPSIQALAQTLSAPLATIQNTVVTRTLIPAGAQVTYNGSIVTLIQGTVFEG